MSPSSQRETARSPVNPTHTYPRLLVRDGDPFMNLRLHGGNSFGTRRKLGRAKANKRSEPRDEEELRGSHRAAASEVQQLSKETLFRHIATEKRCLDSQLKTRGQNPAVLTWKVVRTTDNAGHASGVGVRG